MTAFPGKSSGDQNPATPDDDLERAKNLLGDAGLGSPSGQSADDAPALPADDLDRLYEVSRQIHTLTDLNNLLPRILDLTIAHSQAERGILFYTDPQTGHTAPWVVRGLDADGTNEAERFSRTIIEHARLDPVHSESALNDPRFMDAESVRLHQIRSVICVPILTRERILGALYVDSLDSGRRLDQRAVRFLGILAGLSAVAIENAERFGELKIKTERLKREIAQQAKFEEIVGRSKPILELIRNVERVAATDFPILLVGESGTGKELIARALHRASRRADGPFIAQNCAAIPSELLESEFFGHTRGAFTGAHAEREGLFRLADGGTLFLDEVADLDLRLQAKLLRVLEDGTIRPLGSGRETQVDVRLVSATSTAVRKAVQSGQFRQDLYYRLNVVTVQVPPLRERRSDIPLLLSHFMEKHRIEGKGPVPRLTKAAMKELMQRPWRGNVRELEHFAKRALVLAERTTVDADDLPRLLDSEEPGVRELDLPLGEMTLVEIEEWAIREALKRTGGNQAQAAELLGLHRNAFLRRLQKFKEEGAS